MHHAPEPLCLCGEDRPHMIDTRCDDYRGVQKFCNTCSRTWFLKSDARDVNGVPMTDP